MRGIVPLIYNRNQSRLEVFQTGLDGLVEQGQRCEESDRAGDSTELLHRKNAQICSDDERDDDD